MILNGVITSAGVGLGGRGDDMVNLHICATFSDGWSGLVEGHHTLYLPPSYNHFTLVGPLAHIVHLWLKATDCKTVADMKGKPFRVEFLGDKGSTTPSRIGHIVRDDSWFSTDEICKQWQEVSK